MSASKSSYANVAYKSLASSYMKDYSKASYSHRAKNASGSYKDDTKAYKDKKPKVYLTESETTTKLEAVGLKVEEIEAFAL